MLIVKKTDWHGLRNLWFTAPNENSLASGDRGTSHISTFTLSAHQLTTSSTNSPSTSLSSPRPILINYRLLPVIVYFHQFDYKINDETGRDFLQIGYYIDLKRKVPTSKVD
jgi:hypothetical protein